MKCMVDQVKFGIAAGAALVCFVLACFVMCFHAWVVALVFLALGGVYGAAAVRYGRKISVDQEQIKKGEMTLRWNDVKEVGVVGTKIFHRKEAKHVGARYIYFSTEKLNDDQRFQLCLEWPPKDLLYMRFSYDRIAAIQKHWIEDIEMYNVGELRF